MTSRQEIEETEMTVLPPVIILNPRRKIVGEPVNVRDLLNHPKTQHLHFGLKSMLDHTRGLKPLPKPAHPLNITWSPKTLCFTLDDKPVKAKLWIWNISERPIYFNITSIWDQTIRSGAEWRCFPRTRFWISPGLRAEVFITAAPFESSSTPSATAALQIAAQHLRDRVTCYFAVPMVVKFLNSQPLPEPASSEFTATYEKTRDS